MPFRLSRLGACRLSWPLALALITACEHTLILPPEHGAEGRSPSPRSSELKLFPDLGDLLASRAVSGDGERVSPSTSPNAPAATAQSSAHVSSGPSLVSSTARPEDHTLIFRRHHEKAAAAGGAKCAYCHTGLSEATRDSCYDCHAVMRPTTHTARFATTGHGRIATTERQKCSACHEIDYCTSCHAITPESHFPLSTFVTKHGRVARGNPRSCLTCHSFESTCVECHSTSVSSGPQSSGLSEGSRRF